MRIVAFTNLSLDGVMQAPGRPDEDLRGGFKHGGWAVPYAAMSEAGASMAQTGGLLLGRRTYEDFHAVWPQRKDSPFSAMLDSMPKYVASRTLAEPLPWMNSTLLAGDACDAVPGLRAQPGGDLLIMGSGGLVRSLMQRGLIDLYILMIHPLVLGSGRRLFSDAGAYAALELLSSKATASGVVIATYQKKEQA